MRGELARLLDSLPQQGRVRWIGLRPSRRAPMLVAQTVEATVPSGLAGDRFSGRASSKRAVTLIQFEHLDVLARLLGRESVDPELLRRNIVVSGINLLALKGRAFSIGTAVLEATGPCAPCSYMEEALGAGGYNAVRGHGGITACVRTSGRIALGDRVAMLPRSDDDSPR